MHYSNSFQSFILIKILTFLFITFVIIKLLINTAASEVDAIRIGTVAIPPSLGNPYRNTGPPHLFTWSATFDGLTRFNKNGELIQWLALSWENIDKLTWRINLRDKVTFSNGEKFKSDSVITSINYLISNAFLELVIPFAFNLI